MYCYPKILSSPAYSSHPAVKKLRKRFRKWEMGYTYKKKSIIFYRSRPRYLSGLERISQKLLLEQLLKYVKSMKIDELEYQLLLKEDIYEGHYIEFELL